MPVFPCLSGWCFAHESAPGAIELPCRNCRGVPRLDRCSLPFWEPDTSHFRKRGTSGQQPFCPPTGFCFPPVTNMPALVLFHETYCVIRASPEMGDCTTSPVEM